MTAAVVDLEHERHFRAYCKAIGLILPPGPDTQSGRLPRVDGSQLAPEAPVDRGATLDRTSRAFLAVEEALNPWSDSVLIAALVDADPITRGELLRELEDRAKKRTEPWR